LAGALRGKGAIFIVTDKVLTGLGQHDKLIKSLNKEGIATVVYDSTDQNPTVGNIENALSIYKENNCKAIIAIGGGSPIDCAKGVAVRVALPKKTIPELRGQLKILLSGKADKMPPIVAIPTTAGSGSEVSVSAVIRDNRQKYAINDPSLIPQYVLHDPLLTMGLPQNITATTGMDALCHAVEAYIGKSNTHRTEIDAIKAVRLVFGNLYAAYQDGHNVKARANMQKAAFLAGAAFTRAYVGNIHALSHALSGRYDTPHGLANAVIMPYVLEAYGKAVEKPLYELAIAAGLATKKTPRAEAASRFIAAIKKMNAKMGIPDKISELDPTDIPQLVKHALKEANPLYPVPIILGYNDMVSLYHCLIADKCRKSSF